ncbi:MAG TPA: ABC transporter substrate-binding protein [Microbacteriaceae bacterium]|nr:ABC transporter substrate-binding protein [Microbacteriaceae bacterium]
MSTINRSRARARARLLTTGAVAAASALVLAGCASGSPTPTESAGGDDSGLSEIQQLAANADPNAPEVDVIRGSLWQGPISAQFILGGDVAEAEYGLAFEYDWMTDANVGRARLAAGEIDITPGSPYGAVNLTRSGSDALIVGGNYISQPGEQLVMALEGSGIEDVTDLAGKTIGMTAVTGVHPNRLRLALANAGLDPESLTVVATTYGEMAQQLKDGIIDAASAAAFAIPPIREAGGVEIFDLGASPFDGRPENVWITTKSFYTAHPNAIAAFQCATAAGGALANDRPVMEGFMADVLGWNPGLISVSQSPHSVDGPLPLDKVQVDWDEEVELYGSEPFDVTSILIPFPKNC